MLVDSHCHLDLLDLELDLVIEAAHSNDVSHMLCVCVELAHFPRITSVAVRYDNISISVGEHPNNILPVNQEPDAAALVALATHPKCVAIGETGLDYFRTQDDVTWQQSRFRTHIQAAILSNKPLIIHTRAAAADTIKIMQEEHARDIGGVMHCFTENWEVAKQALDLGFYISFSGIITFKNATQIHEVSKKTPIDRILIETDSPYLAPIPFRGQPNQPAYVKYVAQAVAELRGMSYSEVAEVTSNNFYRLFTI